MGAATQRSIIPLASDTPEFRKAGPRLVKPENRTFDIWLYVWAVRKTGSVMVPVHDLNQLRINFGRG